MREQRASGSGVNVAIISHSGTIIVSADAEAAAADKAMQIHSGILIAIKLGMGLHGNHPA